MFDKPKRPDLSKWPESKDLKHQFNQIYNKLKENVTTMSAPFIHPSIYPSTNSSIYPSIHPHIMGYKDKFLFTLISYP